MTTTKPKAPTPQGISALLRKAGFARSEQDNRTLTLMSGFKVTRDSYRDGTVRVDHQFLLSGGDPKPHLARYAEAISAAGWNVEPIDRALIVTTKEA